MTKGELIEFLKPFTDEIEIWVEDDEGRQRIVQDWHYSIANPELEGRIILCP